MQKDGFGYVEIWENERWHKLESYVTESDEITFNDSINTLCREIKSYL